MSDRLQLCTGIEMYNGGRMVNSDGYSTIESACAKLVASMDPALFKYDSNVIKGKRKFLPQIPQEFIQRYATRNGEVSIIRLEMNQPVCQCDTFEKESECVFKSGIHDCTKPYDGDDPYGHNLKLINNKVIIL